jgi:hypothetical protein
MKNGTLKRNVEIAEVARKRRRRKKDEDGK